MVNEDDAAAQRLHVGHVVAGEQGSRLVAAIVFCDERADAPLTGDILPNGWFVEKEDAWAVQERCGEFAFHALSK